MTDIATFLRPEHWLAENAGPRYVQLRRRIEEGIETGVLRVDSSLPPERELAALTDLSRVTVRKAMEELVTRGAVIQKQGSGSFVRGTAPKLEQSLTQLTSFTEDMARRGLETSSTWLERGVFLPSSQEVAALGLAEGASVSRITRLRSAGGNPMAIERAALPLDILPNPVAVTGSLYEVLERDGNRPVRAIQKISAINLDPDTARQLSVSSDAVGLRIERTSFPASGRAVEFTRSIYRGDTYDFVAELRLSDTKEADH